MRTLVIMTMLAVPAVPHAQDKAAPKPTVTYEKRT